MIRKEAIELIGKYSFIDAVERKGAYIYIRYNFKGEKRFKRLPLRATGSQIQNTIKNIREELGVSIHGRGANSDYYII